MLNKHGQALIEFLLVLPVLLLIIFAFIDFGRIILCKNHLESVMSDVVTIYSKEGEEKINSYLENDEYKIHYSIKKNNYIDISLETKLDLITPGLKSILSNPYKVLVERRIINE